MPVIIGVPRGLELRIGRVRALVGPVQQSDGPIPVRIARATARADEA